MPKHPSGNPARAAQPAKTYFDAWNSSSTGHQRAENRLSGSISWRDSRTAKLAVQLKDGQRGGKRMYDTVGAGSETFGKDGRLDNGGWAKGASGLRKGGQQSLLDCFDGGKKAISSPKADLKDQSSKSGDYQSLPVDNKNDDWISTQVFSEFPATQSASSIEKQIFRGLTIYINGSTYPQVSDHKLKKLLADHGANLSIALGRRTVTHVIIGTPNKNGSGSGGGLAASKIQKEIANPKGASIKFVGVEWVLESIKAGKRLSEANFMKLKLANKGQDTVLGMFSKV